MRTAAGMHLPTATYTQTHTHMRAHPRQTNQHRSTRHKQNKKHASTHTHTTQTNTRAHTSQTYVRAKHADARAHRTCSTGADALRRPQTGNSTVSCPTTDSEAASRTPARATQHAKWYTDSERRCIGESPDTPATPRSAPGSAKMGRRGEGVRQQHAARNRRFTNDEHKRRAERERGGAREGAWVSEGRGRGR